MSRSPLLGAFPILRKDAVSCDISVRPPAWKNSAPIERIFIILVILLGKFKFHENMTIMTDNLTEDQYTFFYRIAITSSENEKLFRQKL